MLKTKISGLRIIILLFLISCNSRATNNLILGTWIPQKGNETGNEQMLFNKDNTMYAQSVLNGKTRTEMIFKYKFSNNGKYLITEESSGKVEEIEIVELTASDLKLKRKNALDTFYLKRK